MYGYADVSRHNSFYMHFVSDLAPKKQRVTGAHFCLYDNLTIETFKGKQKKIKTWPVYREQAGM